MSKTIELLKVMIGFRDASSWCDLYSVFTWAANFSRLQSKFFSWVAGGAGETLWEVMSSDSSDPADSPTAHNHRQPGLHVASLLGTCIVPTGVVWPFKTSFQELMSWGILKHFCASFTPFIGVLLYIRIISWFVLFSPRPPFPCSMEGCCCLWASTRSR